MITTEEKKEMRLILDHFGANDQIIKFGEECGEAATDVLKSLCSTKDKRKIMDKLAVEVADVYNVLGQMLIYFGEENIKAIAREKRHVCISEYILKQ